MVSKIAFANFKGGTGKTTLCINVAAHLAKDHRVLVVDFDPQGNATSALGIANKKIEHSIYDAVLSQCQGYDGVPMKKIILETDVENLHLAPSELDLSAATLLLQKAEDNAGILTRLLEPVQRFYDYVLVDLPSTLGGLTLTGLYTAEQIVVPLDPSIFALEALENLKMYCAELEQIVGRKIAPFSVVLNRYIKAKVSTNKSKLGPSQEVESAIKAMSYPLFTVPDSVIVYRAQQAGIPVRQYSSKSNVNNAFGEIANYLTLNN